MLITGIGKMHSTYIDIVKYGKVGKDWRFFDVSSGEAHAVGYCYTTRELLIADMRRYLSEFWGLDK
jgi:hypothetical protein